MCREQWDQPGRDPRGQGPSPRMRGSTVRRLLASSYRGPAPRVRGAQEVHEHRVMPAGAIPARAGSRVGPRLCEHFTWDHPRACGEQHDGAPTSSDVQGPSPRVRGAGPATPQPLQRTGTIPARAGSSGVGGALVEVGGDHPRACGEQKLDQPREPIVLGPSPRVRGAGETGDHRSVFVGTIPARAGSSLCDLRRYLAGVRLLTTFTQSGITTPRLPQQAQAARCEVNPSARPPCAPSRSIASWPSWSPPRPDSHRGDARHRKGTRPVVPADRSRL